MYVQEAMRQASSLVKWDHIHCNRASLLSAGELLYGRAGAIYALLFARQHTKMNTAATQQLVPQLLQQIVAEGRRTAQQLGSQVQVRLGAH